MDFRFVRLQGHTQVRQHCITTAIDDVVHSKGKELPQLPSALGAPEMHQTYQELIKRQGSNSKTERKYQELLPGTPIWVQHKQNATWEPAIVVNQCAPNSY